MRINGALQDLCMYVCMYVCMYLCMYVWLFVDEDMGKLYQTLGQRLDHFVHELVLFIFPYFVNTYSWMLLVSFSYNLLERPTDRQTKSPTSNLANKQSTTRASINIFTT